MTLTKNLKCIAQVHKGEKRCNLSEQTPDFHRLILLEILHETPWAVVCQQFKLGTSACNDEAVH